MKTKPILITIFFILVLYAVPAISQQDGAKGKALQPTGESDLFKRKVAEKTNLVKAKYIKKSDNGDDISIIKNKQATKQFRPFTIEELSNIEGKKLKENDTLNIEYDGKTGNLLQRSVEVADYLAELNEIELKMNLQGRSQRDDDSVVTGIDNDPVLLSRQRQAIPVKGKYKTIEELDNDFMKVNINNGEKVKSIDEMTPEEYNSLPERKSYLLKSQGKQLVDREGMGQIGGMQVASPPLLGGQFSHKAEKKWQFGSRDKIYLGLSASASLSGDLYKTADSLATLPIEQAKELYKKSKTRLTARAEAKAEGSIFDHGFTMLEVNALLDYPIHKDSNAKFKLNAEVGGHSIYSINKSFKKHEETDDKKYTFDKKYNKTFTLVVPVTVSLGAEGNLGLEYKVVIDKNALRAQFTPHASIVGKASCDVDLFIIRAGVEATLTIISGKINILGRTNVYFGQGGFKFHNVFNCGYNLNMLSGKVALRVQRRNWRWKWKTIWEHELFSWDGFNYKGEFDNGNVEEDTYLKW